MKIAVLQDDLPPHHVGGGGVIAYRLAKEYARHGHEVIAITTVQEKALAGREHIDGIEVYRLYSNYHARLRAYRSVYNRDVVGEVGALLREHAPDVVHVHNVHTHLSYYSLVLARRYARRVIMTEHDAMSFHFGKLPSIADSALSALPDDAYKERLVRQLRMYRWRYNPLRTMIIKRILRRTVDSTIAVSDALARALRGNGISVAAVIHNGIDVSDWLPSASLEHFRKRYQLHDHVILFGGRLSEPKGALQVLQALPAVLKRAPQAQLLVAGKREMFSQRMHRIADDLGITDRLIFTGWLDGEGMRDAYHAASVVVVPSLYLDPFPTVNLEAYASQKPVVATCFGGSREIVEDGVSGYIVNPLNTEALAERIADMLTDKDKATRFGIAGYERTRAEFTLDQQTRAYEAFFK